MHRIYRVESLTVTPRELALQETLFHNANGYIGVRGTLEEGVPEGMDTMRGTYINGFYETVPMKQAEKLTNVAEEKEAMINAADTQTIRFAFDGEWFSPFEGELLENRRSLDMDAGVTERRVRWRAPKGREVVLVFRRMTSFEIPGLFTIDCEITPVNFSGEVKAESLHSGLVRNYANPDDPRLAGESACHLLPEGAEVSEEASSLTVRTKVSGLTLTSVVRHWLSLPCEAEAGYDQAAHRAAFCCRIRLERGQTLRFVKYCTFADSVREADTRGAAKRLMAEAYGRIDGLYDCQRATLQAFWKQADMEIGGDGDANLSMQFNLYQLFQSAGRDGHCSIAAKGLSGEGYEGHYFWDTEMYMLPFFTMTMPGLARKLLSYRFGTLPQARANARLLGHGKGALFPWRTITGRECSGYFLAGSAQYHIDGDIAYAVTAYYTATGDREYMIAQGAEILLETARLWMNVGYEAEGRFRINAVTGPDEYTCLVNNNYYTNACAKHNLQWAVEAAALLRGWGCYGAWAAKLHVSEEELAAFARAAETMYLPYDERLGINPQDDSFLDKPIWDLAATPRENFPLLLHYHPLYLYRHQVCKQADTVLAHVIFDGLADEETQRRSFEYYERITTHDSSLSNCIFCIEACRLHLRDKACAYFGDSVKTDLLNTHQNTRDGIHTANMGGCYMAVVNGFAGLRLCGDGIYADPTLPKGWTEYRFAFQYRGSRMRFFATAAECSLTLLEGGPVRVCLRGGWGTLAAAGDEIRGKME